MMKKVLTFYDKSDSLEIISPVLKKFLLHNHVR